MEPNYNPSNYKTKGSVNAKEPIDNSISYVRVYIDR